MTLPYSVTQLYVRVPKDAHSSLWQLLGPAAAVLAVQSMAIIMFVGQAGAAWPTDNMARTLPTLSAMHVYPVLLLFRIL